MARLLISSPSGAGGILELLKPLVTIGRGSANDLVLDDESVSRFHAVIKQAASGDVVVADRGSKNGVQVNGTPIASETALAHGDRVTIGAYELRFESSDMSTVVIRRAEMPSTLRDVLEGRGTGLGSRALAAPTGTQAQLARRVQELEQEKYLLTVLYDAGKALSASLSVEDLTKQVMKLAFRIEGAERGFLLLFDEAGGAWRQSEMHYRTGRRRKPARAPRSGPRRRPPPEQPQIILSRAILERIRGERAPILITDVAADERFAGSDSVKTSGLRSAMCAPLAGILARQQVEEHARQRAALERFLAPELVEMIAADPNVRLGGVNQEVSVLFCDIRGFTSISERLAPERVVEILNETFTRVTDVVFDHGGTLDKYLGDGLLAVFGAPLSKGNDAANAVRAAIAIQKLVQELNRDAAARQWPELKMGIGVSTGVVTAGNIGSPRRLDYTVVGDTVNVAARLVSQAAGGEILITAATQADLGPGFDCVPMPPLLVKGKSMPLSVVSVKWTG